MRTSLNEYGYNEVNLGHIGLRGKWVLAVIISSVWTPFLLLHGGWVL
jgi:hypothetical protein